MRDVTRDMTRDVIKVAIRGMTRDIRVEAHEEHEGYNG